MHSWSAPTSANNFLQPFKNDRYLMLLSSRETAVACNTGTAPGLPIFSKLSSRMYTQDACKIESHLHQANFLFSAPHITEYKKMQMSSKKTTKLPCEEIDLDCPSEAQRVYTKHCKVAVNFLV